MARVVREGSPDGERTAGDVTPVLRPGDCSKRSARALTLLAVWGEALEAAAAAEAVEGGFEAERGVVLGGGRAPLEDAWRWRVDAAMSEGMCWTGRGTRSWSWSWSGCAYAGLAKASSG